MIMNKVLPYTTYSKVNEFLQKRQKNTQHIIHAYNLLVRKDKKCYISVMYTTLFRKNQSLDGRHQDSILLGGGLKEKKSRQVTRRASGMPVIFCPLTSLHFVEDVQIFAMCGLYTLLCTSYFSISEIFFLFFNHIKGEFLKAKKH